MRINGYYHLQIVVRVLDELLPTMRCDITPKSKLYRGEQYICQLKIFIKGSCEHSCCVLWENIALLIYINFCSSVPRDGGG
jgi:hypothetical protein